MGWLNNGDWVGVSRGEVGSILSKIARVINRLGGDREWCYTEALGAGAKKLDIHASDFVGVRQMSGVVQKFWVDAKAELEQICVNYFVSDPVGADPLPAKWTAVGFWTAAVGSRSWDAGREVLLNLDNWYILRDACELLRWRFKSLEIEWPLAPDGRVPGTTKMHIAYNTVLEDWTVVQPEPRTLAWCWENGVSDAPLDDVYSGGPYALSGRPWVYALIRSSEFTDWFDLRTGVSDPLTKTINLSAVGGEIHEVWLSGERSETWTDEATFEWSCGAASGEITEVGSLGHLARIDEGIDGATLDVELTAAMEFDDETPYTTNMATVIENLNSWATIKASALVNVHAWALEA